VPGAQAIDLAAKARAAVEHRSRCAIPLRRPSQVATHESLNPEFDLLAIASGMGAPSQDCQIAFRQHGF